MSGQPARERDEITAIAKLLRDEGGFDDSAAPPIRDALREAVLEEAAKVADAAADHAAKHQDFYGLAVAESIAADIRALAATEEQR